MNKIQIYQKKFTAQFDHQPEVLENIKQETVQIFNDALTQRGVSEVGTSSTSWGVPTLTCYMLVP